MKFAIVSYTCGQECNRTEIEGDAEDAHGELKRLVKQLDRYRDSGTVKYRRVVPEEGELLRYTRGPYDQVLRVAE